MGNRVYFTLKDSAKTQTYYLHWNGGLDTWAPLCKIVFENGVQDIETFEGLLKALELKAEPLQKNDLTLKEENGHYYVNILTQALTHFHEKGGLTFYGRSDLESGFDQYIKANISPDYQEKIRSDYWNWLHDFAKTYFKQSTESES